MHEEENKNEDIAQYLDTLGNNHNQSVDNQLDKKSTQEVATPVF